MERVGLSFGLAPMTGLLLSGCQLARQADPEKARETTLATVREAVAGCHRQKLLTFVARARCRNYAENLARSVYPYPDLLDLRLTTPLSLAEKTDRREISNEQAVYERASRSGRAGSR